jgi:hypothetical protein
VGIRRANYATSLSAKIGTNFAGKRSVGIVRSRAQAMEFFFMNYCGFSRRVSIELAGMTAPRKKDNFLKRIVIVENIRGC